MKKLRLLLTKECDKGCPGCCNKDWDLDNLQICTSFKGYNEILLTGGEPMLDYKLVYQTIKKIRKENSKAKIYMYTAKVDNLEESFNILNMIDGITVTLHEESDVPSFLKFENYNYQHNKSLRLNIFKGVSLNGLEFKNWKIKDNIKWIRNCPLPKDEVFMRLK